MSPSMSSYHSAALLGPITMVPAGKCWSTTRRSPRVLPFWLDTDRPGNAGTPMALKLPPSSDHTSGDTQSVSGAPPPATRAAAAPAYRAPVTSSPDQLAMGVGVTPERLAIKSVQPDWHVVMAYTVAKSSKTICRMPGLVHLISCREMFR